MTDRTEAMDSLIAQDADLLDVEGVKLYWYRQGKDDGVEQERAKIVAWLRAQGEFGSERAQAWGETFADQIEAGEHLQEQSK